uniref:ATP synthase 8 n=1 Tax=Proasellus ebrensis TaxID=1281961 RepID=A0A485M8R4_9CRUS|nr:ATP synthase 8 [Proasellus ebrensis]
MPQMAPMFWTFLMLMFTFAFTMFMVKLYFYMSKQPSNSSNKIYTITKPHWAW